MNSVFKEGFKAGFLTCFQLVVVIWVFKTIPERMYGPFIAVTIMCAAMDIWAYKITTQNMGD